MTLAPKPELDAFILTINRSRHDMIMGGGYNFFNPNIISSHFPVGEREEVEAVLICPDIVTDEEALREMERQGLRPATMDELIAYGEKYHQQEFPVAALGSVWTDRGDGYVGYICRGAGGRMLTIACLGLGWPESCRFLAVRK